MPENLYDGGRQKDKWRNGLIDRDALNIIFNKAPDFIVAGNIAVIRKERFHTIRIIREEICRTPLKTNRRKWG